MQAKLTEFPVQQVLKAIRALDLEPVKLRVMDSELGFGWTREYADSVESAYKNYLGMLVKHPDEAENIVLHKDVDEFWHTHILQTMKYTHDCQRMFGTYLHHNPHFGPRTQEDLDRKAVLTERTRNLYQKEFGGEQKDVAAWSGSKVSAESSALTQSESAAWSNAGIKGENAAWSNAAIKPSDAAWSNAAIRAQDAAWSNAGIKGENAAWSNAAIKPSDAAWSNAAIKAQDAAWSNAEIKGENAAWSNAAIKPSDAAWSNAAIKAQDAAWSNASIQPERAENAKSA